MTIAVDLGRKATKPTNNKPAMDKGFSKAINSIIDRLMKVYEGMFSCESWILVQVIQ